jgi:hypothetical protein
MLLFSISLCYCIQYVIHFVPLINMDQWYQSGLLFICFSLCMSPTRSGYKKLGLEPVEPLQDREKKYDGAGDPFKMFLEESLCDKGMK